MIPLYIKISNIIEEQILSQKLPYGAQLPTETDLIKQYQVSRITIRKSIELLVLKKLAKKQQGLGTFVTYTEPMHPFIVNSELLIKSFSDLTRSLGKIPSTKFLGIETLTPSTKYQELLKLSPVDKIIITKRIRYADQNPVSYEENIFPFEQFEFLLHYDLNLPLFDIIKQHGIYPHIALWVELKAISVPAHMVQHLNTTSLSPILNQVELIADKEYQILYISEHFFLGDRYKFFICTPQK